MTDAPINETKAERKARKAEEKAAAKRAKQEAKLAKAEAKAAAKEAKAAGKQAKPGETKAERKARLKSEKAAAKEAKAQGKADQAAGKTDAALEEEGRLALKMERYRELRANVRRRRVAYGFIITLAILTFLATAADIVFNESAFQWYLLPVYVVLIVWGLILLFSRRRHLQEVMELEAMHRTYLECERCNSVFQFGELRFGDRKRVGFSCPVCGEDSALPTPGAAPVERVLPEANVIETTYACGNCSEQIVVGTFGMAPRESRFRACPSCGVRGQVSLA